MTTNISYKTAKMLKEFLGKDSTYPIIPHWYRNIGCKYETPYLDDSDEAYGDYPAYQLHDILSGPFCEAMAKAKNRKGSATYKMWAELQAAHWARQYYDGGMEAVEKELVRMMEGK